MFLRQYFPFLNLGKIEDTKTSEAGDQRVDHLEEEPDELGEQTKCNRDLCKLTFPEKHVQFLLYRAMK